MNNEIDHHHKMIQYLVRQTGIDQESIERICYAGEPWTELERLSGSLLQAIQYSKDTGTNPAAPLDAMNSLLKLATELREKGVAKGNLSEEILRLQKKVERIANITKESAETVEKVLSAIIAYSYLQLDRARNAMEIENRRSHEDR
jgi:hypothetical protein